ncbi:MAG: SLBB domain-containing protein, partial [Candidatus Omnitrophota bacterium]
MNFGGTKVEVLSESDEIDNSKNITVEIAGEVIKPGVYKLSDGSRVDDLLVLAGGLTADADRSWTDKYLNRAAKVTDGQKV